MNDNKIMAVNRSLKIQRSIRRHLRVGFTLVLLLGGGVGGWAATTRLSGAVIAPGSVVVDSHVKKVQHLTGGVVGEVRVQDGDHVYAGDVVVRLDDTITRANLSIVSKGLDELMARRARLESERDRLDEVTFPDALKQRAGDPQVAHLITGERNLFDLRRSARLGQKAQLEQRIVQLQQQIEGFNAQADAKVREVELINRELEGVRDLWNQRLTPLNKLTALEREAARLEGERGQLISSVAQAKDKITETRLQVIQIDRDLAGDVAKELRETDAKIDEYVERKVTAEDQLKRIEIRAPQTGTVFQSSVHTVGGVIAPGDSIMLIVPNADNLTVEVKIAPQDIDQVRVGQQAVLRLTAFNQRTTPELNGVVGQIAADTTTDQRTGQSYYITRIALPAAELSRLGDVKIIPGMPAEVFIQTGERQVLSYLIKPIRDQLARAFKDK
jgi:HlyD family secretion protein